MAELLYDQDAYLKEFSARVVAIKRQGGFVWVALDCTAFYPEGGGQPPDWGTLKDASGLQMAVLDAQLDEVGEVWHRLEHAGDMALPETELQVGMAVTGVLDWGRRYDHMQQHCGQHVLSQSFMRLASATTVGFHLGTEDSTVDLDIRDLSPEQIAEVENMANDLVWSGLPVRVAWVDAEGAKAFHLRKLPDRQTGIRVVAVGEFDHSCCAGTHPSSTSEVGLIKVTGCERMRGRTRVHFLCGRRAIRDYQAKNEILLKTSGTLGAHWRDTERLVDSLRAGADLAADRTKALQEHLAVALSEQLLAKAKVIGAARLVICGIPEGEGPELVRLLARQLTVSGSQPVVALLYTEGEKPKVLFARSGTPGDDGPDMLKLLRALLATCDGRGGGKPNMAQGGVGDAAVAREMIEKVADLLLTMPCMREGW